MTPMTVAPKVTSIRVPDDPYSQISELRSTIQQLKGDLSAKQQQLRQLENALLARQSQINTLIIEIDRLSNRGKNRLWGRVHGFVRKWRRPAQPEK